MSQQALTFALFTACLALACDPRGVSVGTEELCVADPTLAVAAVD